MCWHTPIIAGLGRRMQRDHLCEVKASLVYISSLRPMRKTDGHEHMANKRKQARGREYVKTEKEGPKKDM